MPITVPIPISNIVLVPIGHSAISILPLMLSILAPIKAPARGAAVATLHAVRLVTVLLILPLVVKCLNLFGLIKS